MDGIIQWVLNIFVLNIYLGCVHLYGYYFLIRGETRSASFLGCVIGLNARSVYIVWQCVQKRSNSTLFVI